jgi:ABC-type Na+ efflux pump permease subunit
MLTEEEKKYIILAVNSGLKEEFLLLSFLRQSSWPDEKQQAAISFFREPSFKNNLEKELTSNEEIDVDLNTAIVLPENIPVREESIQEITASINKISESLEPSVIYREEDYITEEEMSKIDSEISAIKTKSEKILTPKSDFSDTEKNRETIESFILSSNTASEIKTEVESEVTLKSDTIEDLADQIFTKNENTNTLNNRNVEYSIATERVLETPVFQNHIESGEDIKSNLINVTDHEGNPHSILDLVMIFFLIFIVIVMSVVLFMYVQEVGPFAPINYIKK